ncbi:hypothetical protein TIFTF001_004842 [Ficus carica]|uniref:Uncharacterized protein n=1 Tax=Ficus carica TaxID=3494 RepID=A0AA87ZJY4_FICCA|nr:hypothetical protein TIFTF001_004842 [Ficus carica]
MFCLITCKREKPQSKGNANGVYAKGTSMLKSVRDTDEQTKKQSFAKKNLSIPEGTDAMCPTIQVMRGHECSLLVLVQAASIVLVRSGSGGWRRSKDKNSRYGMAWQRQHGPTIPKGT